MKTYLFLPLLLLCNASLYAQKMSFRETPTVVERESASQSGSEIKSLEKANASEKEAMNNDFQFIVGEGDKKPLVTKEIILFVEENRSEFEDLELNYSERIRIYIPSVNTVSSPDFQELPLYRLEN